MPPRRDSIRDGLATPQHPRHPRYRGRSGQPGRRAKARRAGRPGRVLGRALGRARAENRGRGRARRPRCGRGVPHRYRGPHPLGRPHARSLRRGRQTPRVVRPGRRSDRGPSCRKRPCRHRPCRHRPCRHRWRVVRERDLPGRSAGRRGPGGERAQHRGHRVDRPAAHTSAVRGSGPAARTVLRPVHAGFGTARRSGATYRRRHGPGAPGARPSVDRPPGPPVPGRTGRVGGHLGGGRGAPGFGSPPAQFRRGRGRAHRRRGVAAALHRPCRAPRSSSLRRARPQPHRRDRDPDGIRAELCRRRIRYRRLRDRPTARGGRGHGPRPPALRSGLELPGRSSPST
jgi:hypothetical protein